MGIDAWEWMYRNGYMKMEAWLWKERGRKMSFLLKDLFSRRGV
jgi:hypothetical protein